jgi:hypothetical protein
MMSLHVLATKLCTKASVPIGTPMPMKPSGQKESRRTSLVRCVRVGVAYMMVHVISNAAWAVTPLGRMEVLETLSSRPASALVIVPSSVLIHTNLITQFNYKEDCVSSQSQVNVGTCVLDWCFLGSSGIEVDEC